MSIEICKLCTNAKDMVKNTKPKLAPHACLTKVPDGFAAIGHDAVYLGQLLDKKPEKHQDVLTDKAVDMLIISEDQTIKALQQLRMRRKPAVTVYPEAQVGHVSVANPEFADLD